MRRLLLGSFSRGGRIDAARIEAALSPHTASFLDAGPLQVAFSGATPAQSELACLFDGYLDNAKELGEELGLPARAEPETFLAAGYRRWGRELMARMRGDFVALIWDRAHGEGMLARDQLGVGALYLADVGGSLHFASEIHHLLALLPKRPAPDPVSVAHWVAVSNRPGDATLYAGIRRLNPGCLLQLDRHGAREETYWSPRYQQPLELSAPELAQEVRGALGLAVRRRLDPVGTTGVLMSGGLDSAAVAGAAVREAPGRVSAYAGVFPEHPAVDESTLIEELRETLSLPGLTAEVRPGGLLASAIESVNAWEVPLLGWGDFWALPLLRGAATAGISVMLGGDGGDEVFGSRVYALADRLRSGRFRETLRLALQLPGAGDGPPRREVAGVVRRWALAGALPYRLHRPLSYRSASRKAPEWMLRGAVADLIDSDDPHAWKRMDGPRWWAHAAHGLTRGVEETGVFEHQRRRAALAGVVARHPLFDLDLLELALCMPPESTFDPHRNRPLLRESVAGLLPDSVRLRPGKAWFDSLIVDSLVEADGGAVRRLLTDPRAEIGAYVDVSAVDRELFQEQRSDPFRWMHQVWRLVTAECWLRAQENPAGTRLLDALRPTPARVRIAPAEPATGTFFHLDPASHSSTLTHVD